MVEGERERACGGKKYGSAKLLFGYFFLVEKEKDSRNSCLFTLLVRGEQPGWFYSVTSLFFSFSRSIFALVVAFCQPIKERLRLLS